MTRARNELVSHLFECTDIIRGAVDPTDYKRIVLPLVFYKAISDEFEKEYRKNVKEFDEEIARQPHLYDIPVVPEGYLWDDLFQTNDNIDQIICNAFDRLTVINEAFETVPKADINVESIFCSDYFAANTLTDEHLKKLLIHLDTYDLDCNSTPPDVLGEAFMDIVRRFAELEEGRGGEFFTPIQITKLCVRLIDDFEDGDEFHDPTVGSGGMLIEAARYYREEQGGDPAKLRFTGQEINPDIAAIARMNLMLHKMVGQIECGDSLLEPQFAVGDELERFDYVLANFPFSSTWPKDKLQNDPYRRFDWAERLPRADRGDYAFIMHVAKQLKQPDRDGDGGMAAIVIPHGVLFREHEQRYRKFMLENDLVEAVIGLPEKLFQNTSISSAILILNTDKSPVRKGEVQFIHADDEEFYRKFRTQNELTDDGIDHIVRNFQNWKTEQEVSETASIADIREKGYNLNIAHYVDGAELKEDMFRELTKLDDVSYEGKLNLSNESTFASLLGKVVQNIDNTVIVLGSYEGANEPELVRVKNRLEEMGYSAHLYKDLPDFPSQNLSGSVATTMRLAGFCVMVDRQASGHIDEYRLAEKQRTILARLVSTDGGSTRMIGGSELVDVNYIKSFEFDFEPQERLEEAVEWAENMLDKRRTAYNDFYDWRE